jgi:hypothetical protein
MYMCLGAGIAFCPVGTVDSFPGVSQPGNEADGLPPSSSEYVDLYVPSSIHLHGVVLN